MNHRISSVAAAIVLTAFVSAASAEDADGGDKWQSVAKTDQQEAFVNTSSIVAAGTQVEAKVKQNFVTPQPSAKKDKTFLSSRTTYRFDCAGRRLGMREVRTYAEADLQGAAVQKATSSEKNLQWLDAQQQTVFGEVLDYVCSKAPGG